MNGPSTYGLLQASRRVDWRFLLPQPDLGRTAYVGLPDERLLDALGQCAAELTSLATPASARPVAAAQSLYDLVVLVDPEPGDLAVAAGLLRPDGWLYAEQPRSFRTRVVGAARFPRVATRGLEALGFVDVQAHWHWPDFASCEEMVPLCDAGAIRHMLARRRVYGARAKVGLARLLLLSGLFGAAVQHLSVLGRWKPDVGHPRDE
jgi:hypothetical protein